MALYLAHALIPSGDKQFSLPLIWDGKQDMKQSIFACISSSVMQQYVDGLKSVEGPEE